MIIEIDALLGWSFVVLRFVENDCNLKKKTTRRTRTKARGRRKIVMNARKTEIKFWIIKLLSDSLSNFPDVEDTLFRVSETQPSAIVVDNPGK